MINFNTKIYKHNSFTFVSIDFLIVQCSADLVKSHNVYWQQLATSSCSIQRARREMQGTQLFLWKFPLAHSWIRLVHFSWEIQHSLWANFKAKECALYKHVGLKLGKISVAASFSRSSTLSTPPSMLHPSPSSAPIPLCLLAMLCFARRLLNAFRTFHELELFLLHLTRCPSLN